MTNPIETELKLLLATPDDHFRLRSALDRLATARIREQRNDYLDTSRLDLRAQQAMVRVRVAGERVVATCKVGGQFDRGVHRVTEVERDVPPALAARWKVGAPARVLVVELGLQDALLAPPDQGGVLAVPLSGDVWLHNLGALVNTRRTYDVQLVDLDGDPAGDELVRFELDHARYSAGVERWELEVEHPRAGDLTDRIRDWLDRLEVEHEPATESKYVQFLRLIGTAPEPPESF
ncbi:MAG: CYTH domain-containing protein [Myxococcota bacterium]